MRTSRKKEADRGIIDIANNVRFLYWKRSTGFLVVAMNLLYAYSILDISFGNYSLKKVFFSNPSKRLCRCQKACEWAKLSKETIKNLRNLKQFLSPIVERDHDLCSVFRYFLTSLPVDAYSLCDICISVLFLIKRIR